METLIGLFAAVFIGGMAVKIIDQYTKLFTGPMYLLFGKRPQFRGLLPPLLPWVFNKMRPKQTGATFQSRWEMEKNFNPRHNGLLLDGHKYRLSEHESFAHLVLMAPSRMGKTSRFVIPNIFTLSHQGASMVISDLKGDIYQQTSGYLQRQGYEIKVLNLQNPAQGSSCFNPLNGVSSYSDIAEVASVLVHSSNSQSYEKDPIWPRGAETLLKVAISALQGVGDPSIYNLPNLLRLLQQMGDRTRFEDFIAYHASEDAWNTYKQFAASNQNMMRSFYTVAVSSLEFLSDPVMARLFAANSLDFQTLRQRKTALYIIVPPLKLKEYGPIMNLIYTRLFNVLMQRLPLPQEKSIYLLGDEWGHTAVPTFEAVATTIAQYRVSLSIILQSLAQMEMNYGKNGAKTILEGGMAGKLFFAGLDVTTAQWASDMAGREVVSESYNGTTRQYQRNLFNADRIRTMDKHEALLIHSNREPAMLKNMVYHYQHPDFKRWTQLAPAPFPKLTVGSVRYVQI